MSDTRILRCTCAHADQDRRYGQGMRVHNATIQPYKWKEELVCIPQNISSLVVFYNKDLFDQAGLPHPSTGWTWDDFRSAAQALTKDLDGDGNTDQFGAGTSAELIRLAPFIWQSGGEIVDYEPDTYRLTLDTEPAYKAAEFFFGLQTQDHVVPNAEQEASEDSETRFINGTLAMFSNSRRGVPTYRDSAKFDWDVAALPHSDKPATILHADARHTLLWARSVMC